eukprot:TRINITY_DN67006_c13_g4_i1.p1 TRINITY_DN67006_c13_g4~~TRINITY_DN67006_c13_g4_i1.p1  ORF type:complete len:272 (+),score=14.72 TRINITY_DN67006_c13_g4_i1:99-914(+)
MYGDKKQETRERVQVTFTHPKNKVFTLEANSAYHLRVSAGSTSVMFECREVPRMSFIYGHQNLSFPVDTLIRWGTPNAGSIPSTDLEISVHVHKVASRQTTPRTTPRTTPTTTPNNKPRATRASTLTPTARNLFDVRHKVELVADNVGSLQERLKISEVEREQLCRTQEQQSLQINQLLYERTQGEKVIQSLRIQLADDQREIHALKDQVRGIKDQTNLPSMDAINQHVKQYLDQKYQPIVEKVIAFQKAAAANQHTALESLKQLTEGISQ